MQARNTIGPMSLRKYVIVLILPEDRPEGQASVIIRMGQGGVATFTSRSFSRSDGLSG